MAAGVEVDAGTAGGNPHSWVTGVLRVGDLHQITRTEDTQSCPGQAASPRRAGSQSLLES